MAAIFTQLIGSVLPASGTPEAARLSKIVVLAGLAVQLAALGVFLVVCGRLHGRLSKGKLGCLGMGRRRVRWCFVVFEVVAVMLVVRSVVRGVELVEGMDGVVARWEVFVYVFDAAPMGIVMAGFLGVYPPQVAKEVLVLGKIDGPGEMEELRTAS